MKETLLWLKHKPKNLDDIVLLPRIRKMISGGIKNHLILYGNFGLGKTALADILTKDKPTLYKNTSKDTSIEVLRTEINKHVNTMSDIFDPKDGYKYVYLDEFEKASSAYQDALKAYIDENSNLVRFIFITNHIHKVDNGILTRCSQINFDPINEEEKKWWKTKCKERLLHIKEKESIDISESDVKKIVASNYPSLRKMIVTLSEVDQMGEMHYEPNLLKNELVKDLYLILDKETFQMQDFILKNFGTENVQEMFNLCGRPLTEYIIKKRKDLITSDVFGEIYSCVSEHSMWLNTIQGGDPVVVGTSLLYKIKKLLK